MFTELPFMISKAMSCVAATNGNWHFCVLHGNDWPVTQSVSAGE
jgi:hypothetical protein